MCDLRAMTWEEVRQAAAEGAVALVPTGSLEQHGPHLPVEVDSRLVTEVCRRAVAAVENEVRIVVSPTLWLGCSPHHLPFFALSVDPDVYIQMVVHIGRSLVQTGFSRILFVNGHGGNILPLQLAVQQLRQEYELLAASVSYWQLAAEQIAQIRESPPGGIAHACEMETSMMMAVQPDSVREDKVVKTMPAWKPPWVQSDLLAAGPVSVGLHWPDVTPTGVLGDPTLASREKGEAFLAAAVSNLATFLRQFANWSEKDFAGN